MLGITDPTPSASSEQSMHSPALPSEIEHVQQLLGIETEHERIVREAQTFYLDASDLRQQAGIARAEQMVKSIGYHLLEQGNKPDTARQMMTLKEEIKQAQQTVDAYREQTGRDPSPILTGDQRNFLHTHQDVVRDSKERASLREGLAHAVVSGESSRNAALDYQRERAPAKAQQQPEQARKRNSVRGR
jgi:hypothetical protein